MSNIFYCLESEYRRKGWEKPFDIIPYWKENEGKNSFKKRENEEKAGEKYQELIYRHSSKRSWEAMEGMKLVMEISIRGKHPKNAIFKKAAGNQAGVLWESTKLTSALSYSSHQQSLSRPGNSSASRELHSGVTNLHITPRGHLKPQNPGTHFPQPQAGMQWLTALSMCKAWWEPENKFPWTK